MLPVIFYNKLVTPTLDWLAKIEDPVPASDPARVLVMAIAGQESNWAYRKQIGGPARSYWQFEEYGGVAGVLQHPTTSGQARWVCAALDITCDVPTVYEAMAWNDVLAASMARLLLWTDPGRLPDLGDEQGAWNYYLRNWRPGLRKWARLLWTGRCAGLVWERWPHGRSATRTPPMRRCSKKRMAKSIGTAPPAKFTTGCERSRPGPARLPNSATVPGKLGT